MLLSNRETERKMKSNERMMVAIELTDACQIPIPARKNGEYWTTME